MRCIVVAWVPRRDCLSFVLGPSPRSKSHELLLRWFLERLLRHLAASNMLDEVSPGRYKQTVFSLALLQPVFGEWINYLYAFRPLIWSSPLNIF